MKGRSEHMKAFRTGADGAIALVVLLAPLACGSSHSEEPGSPGDAGGTGTGAAIPTSANSGGKSGSAGASGAAGAGSGGSGGGSADSRPCTNPTLLVAKDIAAGDTHTCALTTTHSVRCWGNNTSGELGDGTTTRRPLSVQVTGIANAVGLAVLWLPPLAPMSARTWTSSPLPCAPATTVCAVLENGSAWCWGYGVPGAADQCSLRDAQAPCALAPLSMAEMTNATGVAASVGHTCAILGDGSVACWGRGIDGELGNGTTYGSATPVAVLGLTQVAALAGRRIHLCAQKRRHGLVLGPRCSQ